jgi:hypothetical protein
MPYFSICNPKNPTRIRQLVDFGMRNQQKSQSHPSDQGFWDEKSTKIPISSL